MTKKKKKPRKRGKLRYLKEGTSGRWVLHKAKAHFSEVVRQAKERPQRITVHGREEVVLMSTEEYARLKGEHSGRLLVDVMRKSPLRDVEIEPAAVRSPVRDVEL